MKRVLIYFSWSNHTKGFVEQINRSLHADIYRLERKIPYSDDYDECAYHEAKEEAEKKLYPEITPLAVDWNSYDEIDLFFPIWWYAFPMPIGTLLKSLHGYKGKIVFFENSYTNDPQYVLNALKDARKIDPNLHIEQGLFNDSLKHHMEYLGGK